MRCYAKQCYRKYSLTTGMSNNLITGYATITMLIIIVSLLCLNHVCFITDQIADQASITATVETIEMRKCDAYEDTSLPRQNVVVNQKA